MPLLLCLSRALYVGNLHWLDGKTGNTEKVIRNNASGFKRDLDHLVDEPADGKCCLI